MINSFSIGKTAKFLGVSTVTLRRWEKSGKISSFRTLGNHRRFQESEIIKINNKEKLHIGYARVSSHDQKEDLIRQSDVLNQAINVKNKMIISDLGSGLNFKKKGLNKLINFVISGQVDSIYLTHKERLMRFGSELFFNICSYFGTKIIILNTVENKSFESTLAEDIIELMTVFSAKLYGKRSHKNKKILDK